MGRKGMGDFTSPLYNKTNRPQGHAPAGRVVQPTIPVDPSDDFTEMQRMRELISLLWQEKHIQFLKERPREAATFISGGDEVSVSSSSTSTATTFTVPNNYAGQIEHIQLMVFAPSFYPDITWRLKLGGALYRPFGGDGGLVVSEGLNAFDFSLELVSGQTVTIEAANGNASVSVTVAAQVRGWYEQLTEWKREEFGRTPKGTI